MGVDLGCSALSASASSAVAVLDAQGRLALPPRHFRRGNELAAIVSTWPRDQILIAVDAPRSVPDQLNENYARRSCEREAQKLTGEHTGSFAGVASLYLRWYEIEADYFAGVKVIETYPRIAWALMGLPGKPKDFDRARVEVWRAVEASTGACCEGLSHHQVDAILCAFTAYSYAKARVRWFGRPGEGLIIVPDPAANEGRAPQPHEEQIDERFRRFRSMLSPSTLALAVPQVLS